MMEQQLIEQAEELQNIMFNNPQVKFGSTYFMVIGEKLENIMENLVDNFGYTWDERKIHISKNNKTIL